MSASFIPPPTTDPALTKRTFVNNPHLSAALTRLAQSQAPSPVAASGVTYKYLFLVETKTESGAHGESLRVPADDMCDAIQRAIAQLVEKHADGIRVVNCRELQPKTRGAA